MISEIHSIQQEREANIWLIVNEEPAEIQIDNHITPLFCCHCKRQLNNLYKLDGGRYGQVGTVKCECGAEIHCVDSDNIVEYLETTTTYENKIAGNEFLDYKNIYRLYTPSWTSLKASLNYDIQREYKNQTINFRDFIEELTVRFNLVIDNSKHYSNDKFYKFPNIINKWFEVLNIIERP